MGKSKVSLEAIDDILGGAEAIQESNDPVEATTKPKKVIKGRPREEDYEARTFRVKKELVQKLRIIATREGYLQKDLLEFALESFISKYEKQKGEIDISKKNVKRDIKNIFK